MTYLRLRTYYREPDLDLSQFAGQVISRAQMIDDELRIHFDGGGYLRLADDGRECCEYRYMTTDDDLAQFAGARFMGVEVNDGPTSHGEWGDPHETAFLRVSTDKGVIVCETHNEHNGYYGGFVLTACHVPPEAA